MSTSAARLLSTGMPIVVAGEEVRVRFTLLALARCEAAYGNLRGTIDELLWLSSQVVGFLDPNATATAQRVAVMLQHVLGHDAPVDADGTPHELVETLLASWEEAWPEPAGDQGKA